MKLINRIYKTRIPISALFFVVSILGCKKLVEVPPPITGITGTNVYSSDATAAAVLTGIYTNMSSGGGGSFATGSNGFSVLSGLSADEYSLFSGSTNEQFTAYYTNGLSNQNGDFWNNIYPTIYIANSAIEGLNAANSLTPAVKQQLLGEATFMRAFCYFYLVNLYGDVPLETGTVYNANEALSRAPKALVWQQIITDLKSAQTLLSANYLDATLLNITSERVRPTSWAATALLARSYLYTGDWADAQAQASLLINNSTLYSLSTLNNVFLANSTEAIWQLQPVNTGENTPDAIQFILPASGPSIAGNILYLSPFLLNSFEPGDQRRVNWVDSVTANSTNYYYAYKYKVITYGAPVTEYSMVLRLGEQYLIRAEAEAHGVGGGFAAAINDLNVIRNRAGLPNTTATPTTLLTTILHERQVELFSEWGHRWLDLKRTGNADAVMGTPGGVCTTKGGTWSTNAQLYPVPLYDLQHDANLTQNPGYN